MAHRSLGHMSQEFDQLSLIRRFHGKDVDERYKLTADRDRRHSDTRGGGAFASIAQAVLGHDVLK
jgi:hypothetical protein